MGTSLSRFGPGKTSLGGRLEVIFMDGSTIDASKDVADAHPNGAKPWVWSDYVEKFDELTVGIIGVPERDRFIEIVSTLGDGATREVKELNPNLPEGTVEDALPTGRGIFDWINDTNS